MTEVSCAGQIMVEALIQPLFDTHGPENGSTHFISMWHRSIFLLGFGTTGQCEW
jgi:hypothetical protein